MTNDQIRTIQDLLLNCNNVDQTKPAIICDDRVLPYQKFSNSINELSRFLIKNNIQKGSRIAVMISDRLEYLIGIYSIINAGFISVPISTRITKKDLEFILEDCKINIIIIDKKNFECFFSNNTQQFKNIKLIIKDFENNKNPVSDYLNDDRIQLFRFTKDFFQQSNNNKVLPEDPALILYTSGTTGKKKGVIITHKNLVETAKYMNSFMKIDDTVREFISVPLTHAFGFGRTRAVLLAGGTIIIQNRKFNAKKVLSAIKKFNSNALSSVSAVFSIFIENFENDCKKIGKNIKWIEIGSMPLEVKKKKKLLKIFSNARIHMNYGMTEAMRCTLIEFGTEFNKISTVGRPSPGVEIKITDYENKKLPAEEIGEILVRGVNVANGYWNNQDEWQKKIRGDWLRTDDIGYLDEDGYLTLIGRKDERVNVGGQKFYPTEVESLLGNLIVNHRYCICGIPDPNLVLGEIPVLCIEEKNENGSKPFSIKQVQEFLNEKVEEFKIPKRIFCFDNFPLTDNGKIRRHEIQLKIMKKEKKIE